MRPLPYIDIRYNVLAEDSQGNSRWVTVIIRTYPDTTVAEAEVAALEAADEILEQESSTGHAARENYEGPDVVQVGGIYF